MKLKLIIFIISFVVTSCNGQKEYTIMTTEKFDVEAHVKRFEESPEDENGDVLILEDSTKIRQSLSATGGASEIITPPKPAFYKIRKKYFKSTYTLELKGNTVGGMSIGIWQFFDEKGKLRKEVNEDEKLDGHDYHKALEFLEKENWITIETGQGRERFSLDYEKDVWYITIMSRPWNGNFETYYEVDANTLKILKKTETQLGDE